MGDTMAERAISPRAAALHDDALVWDMVFVFEPDHGNDVRLFPRWQLPELTDLMLRRGYAEDDVRGILGGNWLRVCSEVWKEPR